MNNREPSGSVVKAWSRLFKAQASVLRAVEADVKAAGCPPLVWYKVLMELRGAGLRPMELEARLSLEQHNVSRLLDRMESKGVIARRRLADDRRGQMVEITGAGRALLELMRPAYGAAIERHIGSKLSQVEALQLASLLDNLLRSTA
jgi:DNA-binding MarR family transcriptional regulator